MIFPEVRNPFFVTDWWSFTLKLLSFVVVGGGAVYIVWAMYTRVEKLGSKIISATEQLLEKHLEKHKDAFNYLLHRIYEASDRQKDLIKVIENFSNTVRSRPDACDTPDDPIDMITEEQRYLERPRKKNDR